MWAQNSSNPHPAWLCAGESIFKPEVVSWADRTAPAGQTPAPSRAPNPNLLLHPFICSPNHIFHPGSPHSCGNGAPSPSAGIPEHQLQGQALTNGQQFKGEGCPARVWVVSLPAPVICPSCPSNEICPGAPSNEGWDKKNQG